MGSTRNVGKGIGHPGDVKFLHGDLDLWIYEARNLPNMDLMTERMRRCFSLFGCCASPFQKASKRTKGHSIITSDPFVSVCLAEATVAQTQVIPNSENPQWNEHFCIPVAHPVTAVEFQVKDDDVFGEELIGTVSIPIDDILTGNEVKGHFPLVGHHENEPYPELWLSLQFKAVQDVPGAGPDDLGVQNAYFPLRKEGNVTLYQDAHVPDGAMCNIPLDYGRFFEQGKCWEDMYHAIYHAQHLIYITGWSVYHPVKLVREPSNTLPDGGKLSLGELLKRKSQEGVRVLMLVWDDKTSHDKFPLKTKGIMRTHDEETRKFFRFSHVHCVLAPRYASSKLTIFKQQFVGTVFSHHQKCVVVDTPAAGDKRKITAFIGGLDLCDGRYDTPEHRLFPDPGGVFENDFYNPTYPPSTQGPRQPWHDLHCRIEGPAAYDVLTNFEQRWRKTSKWRVFKVSEVPYWYHDALIKLDNIPSIHCPSKAIQDGPHEHLSNGGDTENWHVQIFRSIDSGSVKGFPKVVQEAEAKNPVCAKSLTVDQSIHTAYVRAIRSAKHFIYIENQYFIGSSYGWTSYRNAGADNLIPMELALKIATKIKAKEHFSAYIVIPMWPEGTPSSPVRQEILFWQGQTIKMMYKIITNALEEAGSNGFPHDYLNFYCLGKREASPVENMFASSHPAKDASSCMSQKYRRFMIYVHSKGMIVDDEYVILGSANINQRSLDGSRDTEIAMGAYQPNYRWSKSQGHPRGQVFGYRRSLWAEHLGIEDKLFDEPQGVDCVRRVNQLAESNWQAYVSEKPEKMTGHLMKYPVQVEKTWDVSPLPGFERFPDVDAKVLGAPSKIIPDVLTT